MEADRAGGAGAAPRRDLPLLRADNRAVAADRGGAPARAALGARRDVRDPLPAVEHRGPVRPTLPPDGRPHRIHHGRAPGRAGRGRGARHAAQPSPAGRRRALMITVMRRYRKALQLGLLVVIAAFVASLFVFGATGSRSGDVGEPRDSVATVNGEKIPLERFQRRYQSYLEAYAQIYRERFSTEMAERLGLPQQVVGDLVQEALIVQRANAEGFSVSDEELNARIHAIPAFQENGRFVLQRYQDYLKRAGTGLEADLRRQMTRAKVETAIRGGVKVSDTELEQAFRLRREEVRAAWALVELGPLVAAANATDEELTAYLTQHPDEFRQPDRRRVQYVTLNPKDYPATITDAEVEKFYTEHAIEFEIPRQVRAAHVLARVPETGGSAGEDKARAKIADVIRRAKAGADFGKLAQENSDDTATAPRGGDLGLVGQGEMVPDFQKALFALKKGEVSPEPVRTPFGFHAIKVVDIQEASR